MANAPTDDPRRAGAAGEQELILVDAEDRAVGTAKRSECHALGGLRHRAFSVYLFDAHGRSLVQQRHASKALWPGYWSNACCSHPLAGGEPIAEAAERRVEEELGVRAALERLTRYEYEADFGTVGTEHEVVTVFAGRVDVSAVVPHPTEIAALRVLDAATLDLEVLDEARYTPWFRIGWRLLRRERAAALARFGV